MRFGGKAGSESDLNWKYHQRKNMQNIQTRFSSYLFNLVGLLLLALFSVSSAAATQQGKDEMRIIGVIQSQLRAFAADDAKEAFKYAAPNIRAMAGSAERFMEMVQNQYEVVYKHSDVAFQKPKVMANRAVAKVRMQDDTGSPWLAIYTLERQGNKLWRITGCVLQPDQGLTV
jgi:ABC-type transport system involved in cytochrome bd biosynthesis fused ATPase/permease subunit